jgi:hypothetical protein
MPTMLARNSYDTVCHEHQEYYALHQIKWMAERAHLKLIDVELNDVNGGSFCVTAARQESKHQVAPIVESTLRWEREQELFGLRPYEEFACRVRESRESLRQFLAEAKSRGKRVFGLGASTKGNVILQYCAVTEEDIGRIGEVNEDKFGAFTPGTHIPIVSESQVLADAPDYLLVLPWHFRQFFIENPRFPKGRLLFPLPLVEVV